MLIRIALGELPRLLCGHVHNENVQSLIVIEPRHAFARVRLVEIPRDHHRIAAGFCRPAVGR